jgi:hypothetical protein
MEKQAEDAGYFPGMRELCEDMIGVAGQEGGVVRDDETCLVHGDYKVGYDRRVLLSKREGGMEGRREEEVWLDLV